MRVLILSSSTGGGHDMRARAFEAWAKLCPELGLQTQVLRPLDNGPGLYRFGVGLYNWIQRYAPWAHHIYFNWLEVAKPCRSARRLLGAKAFCKTLETIRPDVLLSVHGSLNHGYFELARQVLSCDKVRRVTYCGELFGGYGFSRNWVNPDADLFIGAVKETYDEAWRLKMPPDRARIGGFLLRPEFYDPPMSPLEREHFIRHDLGFDPDKFILLLSASSRGANNHKAFLNAMVCAGLGVQTVILWGKKTENEFMCKMNRLSKRSDSLFKVMPHDTNVAKLLQSVSAVVARPGTGATSEAILSECPLLLNCLGGTMPQEWITVKYCRQHRLARTIHRSDELVAVLKELIRQPAQLAKIRERMRAVRPPLHPRDILRSVANLA